MRKISNPAKPPSKTPSQKMRNSGIIAWRSSVGMRYCAQRVSRSAMSAASVERLPGGMRALNGLRVASATVRSISEAVKFERQR